MGTVTWDAFYPEVLPQVPTCTPLFAANAIRNAAREFTQRTKVWKQDLGPFFLVAGAPTVAFGDMGGLPTDTNVARIFNAQNTGQKMYFQTPDWLEENYNHQWRVQVGTPLYVTQDDENNARFVPYFDASSDPSASPITMFVALWPTENAAGISDIIYQQYKTIIAHGALAILMLTKGTPYFDSDLAKFHQDEFDQGKGDVAWNAYKGHVRSPVKTRGHFF